LLPPGLPELGKHFDWGSLDVPRSELSDPQVVAWATQQLAQSHEVPLFLACGLYRPHVPWYAPREYFDLYPIEDLETPLRLRDDLADVPNAPSTDTWDWIVGHGQEREALRAYLAAISFADSLVGELIAGLDASGRADDTIIVLWSDNGMHFGEKSHIFKSRLWEESTRIPLVIVAPGITSPAGVCERPVNLTDLYPTLAELCSVPAPEPLDGSSLVPLLKRPNASWDRPAIITNGPGNHAIRTQRWRYIRYRNGGEELYDHDADPHEWTNLAGEPAYRPIIEELARWLPG
jgi:arylsulfatase A-like enzyme